MCATAANLIERVLPEAPLRQWVRGALEGVRAEAHYWRGDLALS